MRRCWQVHTAQTTFKGPTSPCPRVCMRWGSLTCIRCSLSRLISPSCRQLSVPRSWQLGRAVRSNRPPLPGQMKVIPPHPPKNEMSNPPSKLRILDWIPTHPRGPSTFLPLQGRTVFLPVPSSGNSLHSFSSPSQSPSWRLGFSSSLQRQQHFSSLSL